MDSLPLDCRLRLVKPGQLSKVLPAANGLQCPHCKHVMPRDAVLKYVFDSSGVQVTPEDVPGFSAMEPVYYDQMRERGMQGGMVPPSYFTSPHNVHTWL